MEIIQSDQALVRIAQRIRDQLQVASIKRAEDIVRQAGELLSYIDRIREGRRQLEICQSRNWLSAAKKIVERIMGVAKDLPYQASQLEQAARKPQVELPSLREIVEDLRELKEEFGGLRQDLHEHTLSVTTEPIELEGLGLGPFEIRLLISRLTDSNLGNALRIVALEPNSPACNSSVTHPHVSEDRLCAGDATTAIGTALSGGRICDAIVLVRSVLTTYNPHSPYVSLEDWDGVPCYECGTTMSSDDTYWCHCCERDFCSYCSSHCSQCDERTCTNCLERCTVCEESVCQSCLTTCPDCHQTICQTCRNDLRCSCHEENQNNEPEQQECQPAHQGGSQD